MPTLCPFEDAAHKSCRLLTAIGAICLTIFNIFLNRKSERQVITWESQLALGESTFLALVFGEQSMKTLRKWPLKGFMLLKTYIMILG